MRKLLVTIALLAGVVAKAFSACDPTLTPTYSTNLGLEIPTQNQCNWSTAINNSFGIIDSSVPALSNANAFTNTNSFANTTSLLYTPIRFYDASLGRYISLNVPATVTTTNFLLPSADGTSGQVLQTNGAGTLSFVTQSGG